VPVSTVVVGAGCSVIDGGAGGTITVRCAAPENAEPALLANNAAYSLPLSDAEATKDSVVDVAPGMALNDAPPSLLTNHCTEGVGPPVAAAVNVAVMPAFTVCDVGLSVTFGTASVLVTRRLLSESAW